MSAARCNGKPRQDPRRAQQPLDRGAPGPGGERADARARRPSSGVHEEKKTLRASEVEREEVALQRVEFAQWARVQDPGKLVFIDEAGSHIAMTPITARSLRGQRTREAVPRNRGTVTDRRSRLSASPAWPR